MARRELLQEFYAIGDVCELTDLKPHVLRYWESQFKVLSPAKNRSGNRVYARKEVELILLVKQLLYVDKYTVDGARQRLDEYRKRGTLRTEARHALELLTIEALEKDLLALQAVLDGRTPPALTPVSDADRTTPAVLGAVADDRAALPTTP
jgi:DNA-binding transcriptional MerR regulator